MERVKAQWKKIKPYLLLGCMTFAGLYFSACSRAPVEVISLHNYGGVAIDEIELSENNFKYLGTYSGTAVTKRAKSRISDDKGVIYSAKMKMLQNAKNNGVELKGSRTLTNVSLDVVKSATRVSITYCADIIEFKK